jgi:hypothetical protein
MLKNVSKQDIQESPIAAIHYLGYKNNKEMS